MRQIENVDLYRLNQTSWNEKFEDNKIDPLWTSFFIRLSQN